mmetsp:Transcript_21854/g.51837  ORF Transcript_21854/g.51837 Transcript_21854/m.51837 type:complete len:100 (-) Transcript_21854:934-1233(-)
MPMDLFPTGLPCCEWYVCRHWSRVADDYLFSQGKARTRASEVTHVLFAIRCYGSDRSFQHSPSMIDTRTERTTSSFTTATNTPKPSKKAAASSCRHGWP